jgi:hypothetical protein
MRTIHHAPTWGEAANLFWHVIASADDFESLQTAILGMKPEIARALAAAQALHVITGALTKEQRETVERILDDELAKQGFPSKDETNEQ